MFSQGTRIYPLHKAAKNGDISKVRGLLETGEWDVNNKVEKWGVFGYLLHGLVGGSAPLHYAAKGGHSDVVALLIKHGADPCSTDEYRRTTLHYAADRGQRYVAALLIQNGADPCSTYWCGRTPLHDAAKGGHNDVAALLIQQGADPCSTKCGRTPLHDAAEGGHSGVAALLIQHGADPCSKTRFGSTPLHYAAQGGHSDVAALLIQRGADPCGTAEYGRTPLHYAAEGGHCEVVALLIQHGADPCSTDQYGTLPSSCVPRRNQVLATLFKRFENGLVQNFILIMSLEHVASTMNIVEANTLFKEDFSRHFPKERQQKMLDRLKNWADPHGIKSLREMKRRLAEAGCLNLAVAAAKHYAEIVKEIMDMSPCCYETFCKDPMSQRHMITSAGCSTKQRYEISTLTDSYKYDAYVAHHSDDEVVADELRGQLKSNGVCCSEPPLPGSIKIKSMCEAVEMARRTVCIFSKTSLESQSFNLTCNVAFGEAEKRKEGVMIPVTTDVDPKSLRPPYDIMQCIPYQSLDFIPKLVDAIKGPTDVPLYGELRDENDNLKREIAALRQQLEDSIALNRRLQAELGAAAAPRQFFCEPEGM